MAYTQENCYEKHFSLCLIVKFNQAGKSWSKYGHKCHKKEEEQEEFFRSKVYLTIQGWITFFGIFKSKHHKMWNQNFDNVSEFSVSFSGLCVGWMQMGNFEMTSPLELPASTCHWGDRNKIRHLILPVYVSARNSAMSWCQKILQETHPSRTWLVVQTLLISP